MARTVSEIKKVITDGFMKSIVMADKYGFAIGDSFENTFSKVSFENILFYIISFIFAMFEKLFDDHKEEVKVLISEEKSHTLNWYKNKALSYLHGYSLIEDSDTYNIANLTNSQITTAKVVKNASAVEKANVVYIKVASGVPSKLSNDEENGLKAYFKEVKDAGVKLQIINRDADRYRAKIDIHFDPMVLNSLGISFVTGKEVVRDAIVSFIGELQFNGQFRHNALYEAINKIDGVEMSELKSSQISIDGGLIFNDIDAYTTPDAGYMKIINQLDLVINYKVYETVSA